VTVRSYALIRTGSAPLAAFLVLLVLASACPTPVCGAAASAETADRSAPTPAAPAAQLLLAQIKGLEDDLVANRQRILRESPDLYALAMLKLDKADLAERKLKDGADAGPLLQENLAEAYAILRALLDGEQPDLEEHGRLERAYLADNDLSAQPYLLYVPRSYDGGEPFGLVVVLHSRSGGRSKLDWAQGAYPQHAQEVMTACRCIMLIPYARGGSRARDVALQDVFRAIRETTSGYEIDPDRIIACGLTDAGPDALAVAARRPDMFAGVIAGDVSPGSDARPQWRLPEADLFRNLGNLPCVLLPSGAKQPAQLADLLRDVGVDVMQAEGDDGTDMIQPEVVEALKGWRRTSAPRRMAFRTQDLNYNRAYWAEVTAISDWGRPAELSGEFDREGRILRVQSDNASAMRVHVPEAFLDQGDVSAVKWNGRRLAERPDADGLLRLGETPSGELTKKPGLCGPIIDAFTGRFVLVYGGDRRAPGFHRAVQAAAEWMELAQGVPTILPANAVTEQIAQRCNLILLGTSENNPLIEAIARHLPIQLVDGVYRVGERSFDADDHDVCMIYPNPLNPTRYVVVSSGTLPLAHTDGRSSVSEWPDFVIRRTRSTNGVESAGRIVYAGYFDQSWRPAQASSWPAGERGAHAR